VYVVGFASNWEQGKNQVLLLWALSMLSSRMEESSSVRRSYGFQWFSGKIKAQPRKP